MSYIGNGSGSSSSSQACCPVTKELPSSSIAGKCGTCGNTACRCILSDVSTRVSSSGQLIFILAFAQLFDIYHVLNILTDLLFFGLDKCPDQSMGRDNHVYSANVSRLVCQAKSTPACQMSKSDQDSDGEENLPFLYSCSIIAIYS